MLAFRGLVEPVAEVVAEVVAGDRHRRALGGVELRGLEPLAFGLPDRRSSQLSYSPFEIEVLGKVNACSLTITGGREAEVDYMFIPGD